MYAGINYVDVPGWPAVVNAACYNDVPRLKQLIAAKANVNEFSGIEPWRFGVVSPLLIASQKGNLEVVKLLISAKANLETAHSTEQSPTIATAELPMLSGPGGQHSHAFKKPVDYASALVFAIGGTPQGHSNQSVAVDGLPSSAVNPRPTTEHAEIVKCLIEAKAHLGESLAGSVRGSASLRTPLMYAVLFNQPQYIQLLINMGADIDARDHNGRTALWYATQAGRVEPAEHLMRRGATLLSATELQDAQETQPEPEPEPMLLRDTEQQVEPVPEREATATTPVSHHLLNPEWSLLHAW